MTYVLAFWIFLLARGKSNANRAGELAAITGNGDAGDVAARAMSVAPSATERAPWVAVENEGGSYLVTGGHGDLGTLPRGIGMSDAAKGEAIPGLLS